jgi:hypothetical protein
MMEIDLKWVKLKSETFNANFTGYFCCPGLKDNTHTNLYTVLVCILQTKHTDKDSNSSADAIL